LKSTLDCTGEEWQTAQPAAIKEIHDMFKADSALMEKYRSLYQTAMHKAAVYGIKDNIEGKKS